jgi:hypothetical protein
MLALLIYCYANGIFSSRRIERATYRDIAVRFVATNLHPDHDTFAVFRRSNKAAFETAFLQVLLLARESGLLRLGMVSIDGTKIDANASKIRSVRYGVATSTIELRTRTGRRDVENGRCSAVIAQRGPTAFNVWQQETCVRAGARHPAAPLASPRHSS